MPDGVHEEILRILMDVQLKGKEKVEDLRLLKEALINTMEDASMTADRQKKSMDWLTKEYDNASEALDEVIPRQTKTVKLMQAEGGVLKTITVRLKKTEKGWQTLSVNIAKSTRGFRMGLLSVMFGLQNLERGISSITAPAMDAFGINEIWSAMMIDFMAPAMEDVIDTTMGIFDAESELSDETKKVIGTGLIWTQVLAGIGSGLVSATLGVTGFATEFGAKVPGMGTDIDGLAEKFAIAGVQGVGFGASAKVGASVAASSMGEASGSIGAGVAGIAAKFLYWMPVIATAAVIAFGVIKNGWDYFQRSFTASQLAAQAASEENWEEYADYVKATWVEAQSGILVGLAGFAVDVGIVLQRAGMFLIKGLSNIMFGLFGGIIDAILIKFGAAPIFAPMLQNFNKTLDEMNKSAIEGAARYKAEVMKGGKMFTLAEQIGAGTSVMQMLKLGYSVGDITSAMKNMGLSTSQIREQFKEYDSIVLKLVESGKTYVTVQDVLNAKQVLASSVAEDNRDSIINVKNAFGDLKPFADSITQSLEEQYGASTDLSTGTDDVTSSINSMQSMMYDATGKSDILKSSIESLTSANNAYNASLKTTSALGGVTAAPTGGAIVTEEQGRRIAELIAMGYSVGQARAMIGLKHGGIVTRPTLAMIGEGGPEAVIPLEGVTRPVVHSPTFVINTVLSPDNIDSIARELAEKYAFEFSRVSM